MDVSGIESLNKLSNHSAFPKTSVIQSLIKCAIYFAKLTTFTSHNSVLYDVSDANARSCSNNLGTQARFSFGSFKITANR